MTGAGVEERVVGRYGGRWMQDRPFHDSACRIIDSLVEKSRTQIPLSREIVDRDLLLTMIDKIGQMR
jgi:hypothetical protein